nr:hypothetical protein [uncultured Marinifilum sp.]
MTRKDKILQKMLAHPLIREKYNCDNLENVEVHGPGTNNLMIESIRTMIKEVEVHKKGKDEVAATLLRMLND